MFKSYTLTRKKNKSGFTLAEVLLTITVLGIIAMQTIPTLINNINNQITVIRVKETMSVWAQVYNSYKADDAGLEALFEGDNQHVYVLNKLATKLNVVKNCGTDVGCFPDVIYTFLNGTPLINFNQYNLRAKAILANGVSILITDSIGACSTDAGDGPLDQACGYISVDVNGFQGPNQNGRDYFHFHITKTGVVPYGSYNDGATPCEANQLGGACAARILTENAINY